MDLIINLISGAVGGNLLGKITKGKTLINTLLGLVGGGVGNFFGSDILSQIGMAAQDGQLGQAGTSAGVGGLLAMLAGLVTKTPEKD